MGVIVLIPHNNNNSITTKNMLKKTLFANPKKKNENWLQVSYF